MPGRHKLLLPLGEKMVIEHTVDNLLAANLAEVIVVGGSNASQIRSALAQRTVKFACNPEYAQGMSTSIKVGVRSASRAAEAYLFSLGDMPLVTSQEIDLLCEQFANRKACSLVLPTFERRRGNPVILARAFRKEILTLSGDAGCRALITKHPDKVQEVPMANDHVLRDLDSPEDYAEMSALLG